VNRLTRVVVRQQASAPADERGHYETILRSLRRYPRTASGVEALDRFWDEILTSIDESSLLRQARHLETINAAPIDPSRRSVGIRRAEMRSEKANERVVSYAPTSA